MNWNWKFTPVEGYVINELMGLLGKLYDFRFKGGEDKWVWGGDGSVSFSIASIKKLLYQATPLPSKKILEWNSWVPLKVNALAWRAIQDRLPTIDNLIKRKICFGPNICNCCMASVETVDHMFTSCYVVIVWQSISTWCNIPPISASSVEDIFDIKNHVPDNEYKRKTKCLDIEWDKWKCPVL
ncbi:uncharacterized protein LOC143529018 [Bidens hawaiensis]|uniref:uncharacterized protein LOC143529018 n=1 Tax=Bidens hawaiensis TaxID=980011 RepID=UPI0040490D21